MYPCVVKCINKKFAPLPKNPFFIAGFIGVIPSIILNKVDIGHTFFSGFITELANGIGPGAMVVGLLYAYSNIKSLGEAKERLRDRAE